MIFLLKICNKFKVNKYKEQFYSIKITIKVSFFLLPIYPRIKPTKLSTCIRYEKMYINVKPTLFRESCPPIVGCILLKYFGFQSQPNKNKSSPIKCQTSIINRQTNIIETGNLYKN